MAVALHALPSRYRLSWLTPHSHQWFDPDAPGYRVMVVPIIGDGPRQMKAGHVYRCRECGQELEIPERFRTHDDH